MSNVRIPYLEAKEETPSVAKTGLYTCYWKEEARQPAFWLQHPYHGKATRQKPLFKDSFLNLFINKEIAETAQTIMPAALALAMAVRKTYLKKTVSRYIKSETPTKQVVLLGSGYDTLPVRKKKYPVRYFEIDLPEVLDNKESIYKKHQIDPNAAYLRINYTQTNFMKELINAGLNTDLPTHFVWEGNTMYLSHDEVLSTLIQIKNSFSAPVYISFDYIAQSVLDQINSTPEVDVMLDKLNKAKSPFRSGYHNLKTEIAEKVKLNIIEDIVCSDLTKHYGVGDQPYHSQDTYYLCTLSNR